MMKKLWILMCLGLWLAPLAQLQAQKAPINRWVLIQSAQEYGESDKGFWDVPGYPEGIDAGDVQNIQVWKKEIEPDRQFSFLRKRGNVYDIAAGHAQKSHLVKWEPSLKKNGVNIQIRPKRGDGSDEIYNRQEFTFKYVGAGRWKIYSDDGRVMCLAGSSSKNGSNVHLWEDHQGLFTEWLFIDPETGEVIYPEFDKNLSRFQANSRVSERAVKDVLAQIDKTYKALYETERRVFRNMKDIMEARETIRKSVSVVEDFDDLNNQVYTAKLGLKPITFIPYVGAVAKPIHIALGHVSSTMESVNDKVEVLGKDVVFPTSERFDKSKEAVYSNETRLAEALGVLKKFKLVYVDAAYAATRAGDETLKRFASHATELNKSLKQMETIANSMGKDFDKIQSMNAAIEERAGTVNNVYSALRKMATALDATSDASEDIKDFMQKKYSGVSLEDVLEGNIAESIPGLEEWKEKMLGKITDKLGIDIPSVPGIDKFEEQMSELKANSKKVEENNEALMEQIAELQAATGALRTPFTKSIACIPYKFLEYEDLTTLDVR